jgi:glycosyltransferase involved in cell wall biosynthesis
MSMDRQPVLSVVTPAYNEAENLVLLYNRLSTVLSSSNLDWEWIIVDDHSDDETFAMINHLANQDSRVRGVRLARNFGEHIALTCGLHHVRGECAVIMAGDLQDPPEILPALLEQWDSGAQVVWAERSHREGEKISTIGLARLYYILMRRVVGIREISAKGADFVLVDRCVVDALRQFRESNVSLFALITWMGFRQTTITYDQKARLYGSSGWSVEKKLKLTVDSITSFTYLPIRLMSYFGVLVALAGFVYAAYVVFYYLAEHPPAGWSSIIVAVLIIGGIQMLMMGILGEYLWRALSEARGRPCYWIEAIIERRRGSDEKQDPRFDQSATSR